MEKNPQSFAVPFKSAIRPFYFRCRVSTNPEHNALDLVLFQIFPYILKRPADFDVINSVGNKMVAFYVVGISIKMPPHSFICAVHKPTVSGEFCVNSP